MKVKTQKESLASTKEASRTTRQNVHFSTLEIFDHPIILGDSPSTSEGPPLMIDWKCIGSIQLTVNAYEVSRGPRRVRRELVVPRYVREKRLRDVGYSRKELRVAAESVLEAQYTREMNARKSAAGRKVDETAELISRKLRKWMLPQSKSDKELYKWLETMEMTQDPATFAVRIANDSESFVEVGTA
jgi:hypothetical protein